MKIQKNKKGFTLVETIVAVMLFAVLFAAMAIIISRMVTLMNVSKDRAKANKYLQDTLEYLRVQRDSVDTWPEFITDVEGDGVCELDLSITPPQPADINPNDSQFVQDISISSDDCSKKALFTITITWGNNEKVVGESYLASW